MTDKLLNIGPKSAAWLRQVGVRTMDDLKNLGAIGAFLKVKRAGFRPSLNLLYALAGAEQGRHWASLSAEEKGALVTEAAAREDASAQAKRFVMPARDVTPARNDSASDAAAAMPDPGLFDSTESASDEGGGGGGESQPSGDAD